MEKIDRALEDTEWSVGRWSGLRADVVFWICGLSDKHGIMLLSIHWASDGVPAGLEAEKVSIEDLREDPQRILEGMLCKVEN